MEEKLTPEMKEVIAKLGELVKADERYMPKNRVFKKRRNPGGENGAGSA